MTVRTRLQAQLRAYDDDAWTALANRGLLRRARKDLEQLEPAVAAESDERVQVRVGDQTVTFDERGPAQAVCTCASTGPCQHLVAAGLWLAGHPPASSQASEQPPDQHDELMSFDTVAFVAHAGAAGHRWAHQYAGDLDPEHDVRITRGRITTIALASPRVTFRYLGGGLTGLLADVRLSAPEKYQVAAVLAYQRAHGAEPAAPAPSTRQVSSRAEPLEPSRERLRAATARLVADSVRLGLTHLSPAMHERFETVAVWAQGASYHRLALLLRRLADQVELLLVRSALADEQRLLDDATTAFALVAALDAAAAEGKAPAHLLGHSRNRYDGIRRMEIVGLGSAPWHTGSGYQGLTTLFWWPDEHRFVSLTDARPDTLSGWDPRARHGAPGPWAGLRSPAQTAGARLVLTDAQLSPTGRLSGVERTHAAVTRLPGAELVDMLPVARDFASLERAVAQRAGLLATPDPLRDWMVLAPTTFGVATFDPVSQALSWPVADADGATVVLALSYTSVNAVGLQRLEDIAAAPEPPAAGTLVVCRLGATPAGLVGEPLSLVHPGRREPEQPVEELHFPAQTSTTRTTQLPAPADVPRPSRSTALPQELVELASWHTRHAERGTAGSNAAALTAELAGLHARLRHIGFDVFPAEPASSGAGAGDVAEQLLVSRFLARQVEALLTGGQDL